MDVRPCYKEKLQNACLVHVLPAGLHCIWDIQHLVCSQEVWLSDMQGPCEVHLIEEGWEVFIVRQTSSIPSS
jgi:hypothetical protein